MSRGSEWDTRQQVERGALHDSVGPEWLGLQKLGGEGGIRTLGTGVSPYNGLAIHKLVLNRLENFLPYYIPQRVTNQSI